MLPHLDALTTLLVVSVTELSWKPPQDTYVNYGGVSLYPASEVSRRASAPPR